MLFIYLLFTLWSLQKTRVFLAQCVCVCVLVVGFIWVLQEIAQILLLVLHIEVHLAVSALKMKKIIKEFSLLYQFAVSSQKFGFDLFYFSFTCGSLEVFHSFFASVYPLQLVSRSAI